MLPALAADSVDLRQDIGRVRATVSGAGGLIERGLRNCEFWIATGGRPWLADDGEITAEDHSGDVQVVMNLPAGSVYASVDEASASGPRFLTANGGAGTVLRFVRDRVVDADGPAAARLDGEFAGNDGEPRRISHFGIGPNLRLWEPIGWTTVDGHIHGAPILAFGENRYLGGSKASSLNLDVALPGSALLADGRLVVEASRLTV